MNKYKILSAQCYEVPAISISMSQPGLPEGTRRVKGFGNISHFAPDVNKATNNCSK